MGLVISCFFKIRESLFDQPDMTIQKKGSILPSDERIQILQESCKMIQNLQDSCKNLASFEYQSRQKNKSGCKCFRKHL